MRLDNKLAIIFIVASFINISCRKNNEAYGTAQAGVRLHYIDSAGQDIFSVSNDGQNGFWMDSVVASDLKRNGSGQIFTCLPNGCQFRNLNVLMFVVCPNGDVTNRYSNTLIHLKSGMNDTLRTHIDTEIFSSNTSFDSVWYNGKLVRYSDSSGTIPIVR
jgi:hypothetical protein